MRDDAEDERRRLVAVLERHWPVLSLKDASRLSPDAMPLILEGPTLAVQSIIKDTLTFS